MIKTLKTSRVDKSTGINDYLAELGYQREDISYNAYELVKRPDISIHKIIELLNLSYDYDTAKNAAIEIRYEGYIGKARKEADRMLKMDNVKLPNDLDYATVENLSLEARQKLNQIKPMTLGQTSRISGINPADIQVLAIYLKQHKGERHDQ